MLGDPDTLWHIALGQEILRTGHIPTTDIYSHTHYGAPYISKDWLSEVIFAFSYNTFGFFGVFFVTCFSVTIALALLASELSKKLSCTVVIFLCLGTVLLIGPHMSCRPHVLIFPLIILWIKGLLKSAETKTPPSYSLILILLLWSNMHGSFILGILITPLLLIESFFPSKSLSRNEVTQYILFCCAALLVPILGPNGFGPYVGVFKQFLLGDTVNFISEWQPQDFSHPNLFEFVLLGSLGFLLIFGIKIKANRVFILILLLHMALSHKRHADFLGLIGPLLLASPISETLVFKKCSFEIINKKRVVWNAFLIMSILIGFVSYFAPVTPPARFMPYSAVQKALAYPIDEKVFNNYDFGGYLIFSGKKTYIDGRQDFFGSDFVRQYKNLISSRDPIQLQKFLEENKISWSLLKPEDEAAKTIDELTGWQKVYIDQFSVVHIKTNEKLN
ncbi:MAG: hypothetical protein ACKOW3_07070 [Hyphomicrobium sp.]